jgi:hypothetical protein
MVRTLVPWLLAAALFAAAALALQVRAPGTRAADGRAVRAGGDDSRPAVRTADRDQRWPVLARSGARWHDGAEFVLLTRARGPQGVRSSRERWVLLRRDSLGGDFELQPADAAARVQWLPFYPAAPGATARPGRDAGVHLCAGALAPVKVPAGRCRCARTWREATAPGGAQVRVDEWWAPGIPVPVQRWTRRRGAADTLAAPPRRAADVRPGAGWAVLERIRRP